MTVQKDLLLTCDAGTTGCKCTVFNAQGEAVCSVKREYPTSYPRPNWAEQDPVVIKDAVFDGIKEGIASVFTTCVNAIIRGINKVIKVPFDKLNDILKKLKNIEVLGMYPFNWVTTFTVPQIPELEKGAVLEKGQVGLLEGNGAEAVVPLHQNKEWISAVARDMDTAMGATSGGKVLSVLLDILAALEALAQAGIYLDTEALVGGLARPMDRKLGQLQAAKGMA